MWQQPGWDDLKEQPLGEVKADPLDRALIAGLLLEVILQEPAWPAEGRQRQQQIRNRLGNYLVEHLAGRVSLDRFRTLARHLDQWFDYYYPLLSPASPTGKGPQDQVYYSREPQGVYLVQEEKSNWLVDSRPPSPSPPPAPACREEVLAARLAALREHLPRRSHAKLTLAKLKEFFQQSAGGWFRLRDFERFLQIDRKTAWDYLQQFLQWGLLCHNQRQSSAVRYCLDPALLKVAADTLRLALALALPEFPEETVDVVGDFLIATGGEPFPLPNWQEKIPAAVGEEILTILQRREILLCQSLATGSQLLRLHPRWLQGTVGDPEAPETWPGPEPASPSPIKNNSHPPYRPGSPPEYR